MAVGEKVVGKDVLYDVDRIFVRGLQFPKYALKEELEKIRKAPRVIHARELPRKGGPQIWNRWLMEPKMGLSQSIQSHMVDVAPGGRSQRHGHMNEAVFYILDGKGYDIHDGKRYDYEAGDVVVVHNGCVHQHFNADPQKPLRALVIKSKPLYLFMNLIFQASVIPSPKDPVPGFEGWEPSEL